MVSSPSRPIHSFGSGRGLGIPLSFPGFLVSLAVFLPGTALQADFLRGDASQDQRVNIADAITLVQHLFGPVTTLDCRDAADANDDGRINVTDVVVTLEGTFRDRRLPNPGSVLAGPDPTCDALDCASAPDPTPALVLSEIRYNDTVSPKLEWVELHNRSNDALDAGGYGFVDGIEYVIPDGTIVPAGGFLIVLKSPEQRLARAMPEPKAGPYEGWLADGGERLTLRGECTQESVRFDDRAPWPIGADGYGPSLERIDYRAPAADFRSWRTSSPRRGTPGAVNSTLGIPPSPVIRSSLFEPPQPSSSDEVRVTVVVDAPYSSLEAAFLHWEAIRDGEPSVGIVGMTAPASDDASTTFVATLPRFPSQTLVRMNVRLQLADGSALPLPHPIDPDGFLSYFVYNFEVESRLPILWLLGRRASALYAREGFVTGAVVLDPVNGSAPQVFDGASVFGRNGIEGGQKLRFLKGAEYQGERTLNIISESRGGTAPFMEHLGYNVWRDLGGLAPWARWFRVIDMKTSGLVHEQRLVFQQVNERFLEQNGLNASGDLYKLDKQAFSKQTNPHTGSEPLRELLDAVGAPSLETSHAAVLERYDLENVCLYSALGTLVGNWDGFHNNLFVYHDLTSPEKTWKVIPWDLDQIFRGPDWNDFPVDYPLTGSAPQVSRPAGTISRPFHRHPDLHQIYLDKLRSLIASDGPFTVERISAQMNGIEALLLEDLALEEAFTGVVQTERSEAIRSAYTFMRGYVTARVPYLRGVLQK